MNLRRRDLMALTAGSLLPFASRAADAAGVGELTVADVGAEPSVAMRHAFYDPFERETGVRINAVPHEADPVTQFRLMVDTRSYLWDVCMLNTAHVAQLEVEGDYLERIDIPVSDTSDFLPGMVSPTWMGFSVYAVMMAWQTAHFPQGGPRDWGDFWDVRRFPGRRSLCRSPTFTLELALLADGVAPAKLYPLDVERAFASLRRIKDHIAIWWANGAQNTFILESDEVDLSDTWSARAQSARAAGAPLSLLWNGLYDVDGWGVPKGSPRAGLARTFIRFCARADRQAEYARYIANGPTNRKAFSFLSRQRAIELPTSPENFSGLTAFDSRWWGSRLSKISEQFEEFLLE